MIHFSWLSKKYRILPDYMLSPLCCPTDSWQQGKVFILEYVIAFLAAVAAGAACHYIIKWLDSGNKDNKKPGGCFATVKRKEESPDCAPTRFGDSFL